MTRSLLLLSGCMLVSPAFVQADEPVDFAKDIQPLLRARCFSCHGPEEAEGGLRLDLRKRAFDGGDSGESLIVPKSSDKSHLYLRVAGLGDGDRMPPEGEGKPLSPEEIALVKRWIDEGAEWPESADAATAGSNHWAYQPIRKPDLPTVKNKQWGRNGIDAFILRKLEAEDVAPSAEADRSVLIRRVYLDLLGLPPSSKEWQRWMGDENPDWYAKLVDELLASPHYGERWGRWWLDAARYADSDGFEKDRKRPHAWRWRDWVINAINADRPFDEFTIDQLAGDLRPSATLTQRVATGFNRNTLVNTEGGTDKEEDRVKRTVDRLNTLGAVWLGTTIQCSQCHSHKYDPFTQREFYSLYAFFNSMDEPNISVAPEKDVAAYLEKKKAYDAKLAELSARTKDLESKVSPKAIQDILAKEFSKRSDKELETLQKHFASKTASEYAQSLKELADHKKKTPVDPRTVQLAQAITERSEKRQTQIHIRGDFQRKGDAVQAGVPEVLPAIKPRGGQLDRLDLARWIMAPENPLTARVTVNRIWQQYFGRGIVESSNDFGTQGELPSHPELLDWLATWFREDGWSLKRLHRLIVTSATYRQSSAARRELSERDPYNRWLARQNRLRVEAETIRDIALEVSGLLKHRIGGPSVFPRQPAGIDSLGYANSVRWTTSSGDDLYRRGLYTFFQRTVPYPMLTTFDAPDSNTTCTRRERSNTPLQALTIWNDPVFVECAQRLGREIVQDAAGRADDAQRIERAFVRSLGRVPNDEETEIVRELLNEQRELAKADAEATKKLIGEGAKPEGVADDELAAWIVVGRTLMNLDEFITRE